jgi:hypothetical protein
LEAQQAADYRCWAGLGLRVDLERHLWPPMLASQIVPRKTYIELGQIIEASGGDGVIDLELVAFAQAIGSLDKQSAVFASEGLGELDHRYPRIERCLNVRTLKSERAGGAFARLLRAQSHLATITGDIDPDNLAAWGHRCAPCPQPTVPPAMVSCSQDLR